MSNFEATWKMLDASDNEVAITMRGENATDGVNTLAARKEFIEKALERGWTLVTGRTAPAGTTNGQSSEPPPRCEHGAREFKQGVNRNGKPYKGFFCTQQNSDCKPLWVK